MVQRVDWNTPSSRKQCSVGRVMLHHILVMKEIATFGSCGVTSGTDHPKK